MYTLASGIIAGVVTCKQTNTIMHLINFKFTHTCDLLVIIKPNTVHNMVPFKKIRV